MKKSTSGKFADFWFAAWFAPMRFIGEYWFGIGLILLRLSLGWTTRNLENQFEIVLRLFSLLNLYFDADSTQIFSSKYSKYRLSNPNYPFPNEQPRPAINRTARDPCTAPASIKSGKYRTKSNRPVRQPSGSWIPGPWPRQFLREMVSLEHQVKKIQFRPWPWNEVSENSA